MPEIKIHIMQHKKTGLLAAMSEDLKGFMVHAHNEEEMVSKGNYILDSLGCEP